MVEVTNKQEEQLKKQTENREKPEVDEEAMETVQEENICDDMVNATSNNDITENDTTVDNTGEEDTVSEEEAAQAGEAEGQDNAHKKKKGSSKKPRKDKKDEKIEELNDRLMRNLAEFENFRNRSEREKSAMFEIGAKSVIEKMLPVMDNLERGFDGLSDEERETPFVKGIEAVYKQLQTVFEELGVTPIEAVGQEFDPNLHNAVMHDEDDSEESNKVIEEFQKGYLYKDSVVRHSMVKVLN